jgi:hypothetical protein
MVILVSTPTLVSRTALNWIEEYFTDRNVDWAVAMAQVMCESNGATNTCSQQSSTSCSLVMPIDSDNGVEVAAYKTDSTGAYANW